MGNNFLQIDCRNDVRKIINIFKNHLDVLKIKQTFTNIL